MYNIMYFKGHSFSFKNQNQILQHWFISMSGHNMVKHISKYNTYFWFQPKKNNKIEAYIWHTYYPSKKSWPILSSDLLTKLGHDFLDIQNYVHYF